MDPYWKETAEQVEKNRSHLGLCRAGKKSFHVVESMQVAREKIVRKAKAAYRKKTASGEMKCDHCRKLLPVETFRKTKTGAWGNLCRPCDNKRYGKKKGRTRGQRIKD